MRRCKEVFAGDRCTLVSDHELGFGHLFMTPTGASFLDDPYPPMVRPNWTHAPYPRYRSPLRRIGVYLGFLR